jgi:NOL1/NOP2/fmu family ribosome biogenesis protein
LALSPEVPAVDFSREEALLYLKKEHFWLPATQRQRGWVIGRFEGLPIGWLKVLPDRWNNYLPAERRLRRSLS